MQHFRMLGIESSCDDTSVSIVNNSGEILFHKTIQQTQHSTFGGVIPEIASRLHLKNLPILLQEALSEVSIDKIDGISVTSGPGMIGGLIVGIMIAKGLSYASDKKCLNINHLEAHALTSRIHEKDLSFPYLLLLFSGGNCLIILVKSLHEYYTIGKTRDDTIGECYDKISQMLSLDYPGGPIIEKLALEGNENSFFLPRPLLGNGSADFSFSGLKTAVLRTLQKIKVIDHKTKCDISSSFQKAILDVILDKLNNSLSIVKNSFGTNVEKVVIAGGVSANRYLCDNISNFLNKKDIKLFFSPKNLCTDNAAMIAWTGIEIISNYCNFTSPHIADINQLKKKMNEINNLLDFKPIDNWPLDSLKEKYKYYS